MRPTPMYRIRRVLRDGTYVWNAWKNDTYIGWWYTHADAMDYVDTRIETSRRAREFAGALETVILV